MAFVMAATEDQYSLQWPHVANLTGFLSAFILLEIVIVLNIFLGSSTLANQLAINTSGYPMTKIPIKIKLSIVTLFTFISHLTL